MPHPLHLTLQDPVSGEPVVVSGTWSDDEWWALESYAKSVADLRATGMMKGMLEDGNRIQVRLNYTEGQGMELATKLPPNKDVAEFLHELRPFILTSEPASFDRVRGLLAKRLDHSSLRTLLHLALELYRGDNTRAMFQMRSNDVLLNSERTLMEWLNAFEYHRDRQKQEAIEALHRMVPLEFSRAVFITLLVDKADAIFKLSTLVDLVLGRRERLTAQIPKNDLPKPK